MPGNFSAPVTPDRLETLTIVPPGRIRQKAALLQRKAPRRPTLRVASHSAALVSRTSPGISTAALLTRVSHLSRRLAARSTCASSLTSTPSERLQETTS